MDLDDIDGNQRQRNAIEVQLRRGNCAGCWVDKSEFFSLFTRGVLVGCE